MVLVNSIPSCTFSTTLEAAQGSPILSIRSLNSWRPSALRMVAAVVPKSFTLWEAKKPDSSSSMPRFKPACPPSVGRMLSGFSVSMICSKTFTVKGSIYTLSAISLSVMIVAGLEFTRITSTPSSFKERQAWVPA